MDLALEIKVDPLNDEQQSFFKNILTKRTVIKRRGSSVLQHGKQKLALERVLHNCQFSLFLPNIY